MNPNALELIAANTSGCRISRHIEITIEETVGKIAHRKLGRVDTGKYDLVVPDQSECRVKLMDAAAQCTQLLGGFCTISRLGKTFCPACKRLIGTQHKTPRQRGC